MTGQIDIRGADGGMKPVVGNITATSTSGQQPAYDETVAAVSAITGEPVPHITSLPEDRRGGIELPFRTCSSTGRRTRRTPTRTSWRMRRPNPWLL